MIIRYTSKAKIELEQAFEWYESQRRGLGFEFLDCIEVSIKTIQSFPQMYPVVYNNFRRNVVRRFPFSIFYTIEKHEIIIHAIFDTRQHPSKLL
jgi:toxin ParE1/3/4